MFLPIYPIYLKGLIGIIYKFIPPSIELVLMNTIFIANFCSITSGQLFQYYPGLLFWVSFLISHLCFPPFSRNHYTPIFEFPLERSNIYTEGNLFGLDNFKFFFGGKFFFNSFFLFLRKSKYLSTSNAGTDPKLLNLSINLSKKKG